MSRKKVHYPVLMQCKIQGKRYGPDDTVSSLDIPSSMIAKSWMKLKILGDPL